MKKFYYLTLLFWTLCAFIFFLNGSHKIIKLRPQSVHVWRQTDCVSYALNYFQNNQPFFEPQTHTLTGINGHTTSEFPIIYYLAAKLYHVFGPKEAIIRAINFSLFLLGCTCLFWMCFELFENKWLAFVPSIITFTSPYLYYYGLNFLPDVPAFSLALVGWFLSFRYFNTKRLVYLYIAALVFCLAALLKISAGISLVSLIGMIVWRYLKGEKNLLVRGHLPHSVVLSILIIVANLSWIQFAKHYNEINQTGQNLLGLFPIWEANTKENLSTLNHIINVWSLVILHPLVWVWIALISGITIWKHKLLDSRVSAILVLTTVGSLLYSLMWYQAYRDHDYYMINPFISIVWLIIAGCAIADKEKYPLKNAFVLLLIPVIFFSVKQSRKVQKERYYSPEFKFVNENYFNIEPFIRSLGISRHDIVFSVPDISPNITLYYLNQPGWTEAFNEGVNFKAFVDRGVKYFITADTSYIHHPKYAEYIGGFMGSQNGIYVYRINR